MFSLGICMSQAVMGGDVDGLQETNSQSPLLLFCGTCCGLILDSVLIQTIISDLL